MVFFQFETTNFVAPVSSLVAVPLALLRGTSELIMSEGGRMCDSFAMPTHVFPSSPRTDDVVKVVESPFLPFRLQPLI